PSDAYRILQWKRCVQRQFTSCPSRFRSYSKVADPESVEPEFRERTNRKYCKIIRNTNERQERHHNCQQRRYQRRRFQRSGIAVTSELVTGAELHLYHLIFSASSRSG